MALCYMSTSSVGHASPLRIRIYIVPSVLIYACRVKVLEKRIFKDYQYVFTISQLSPLGEGDGLSIGQN